MKNQLDKDLKIQSDEIIRLNKQIKELKAEIKKLKSAGETPYIDFLN
jgi:hypothetical protein